MAALPTSWPSWVLGLALGTAVVLLLLSRRRLARSAAQVAELQRERELVLRGISDNVTYVDTEMRVVWTNWTDRDQEGERQLPRPERAVRRGDICHQVIAGEVRPCPGCPVPRVLQTGVAAEGVVECRDGTLLRLCAAPVRDDRGEIIGVVQTARDITEKRRLAERLTQVQRLEAVGQLAAGVAHDFNNCLQVVLGHAEMLADDLPPDHELRGSARAVVRAGRQARDVVRRLLTFGRHAEPRLERCDLAACLGDQLDLLRRIVLPPVSLEAAVPEDLPRVVADPSQVAQVLTNLVVNARDAMPDGGRIRLGLATVELTVRQARAVGAPSPGRYVELTVQDEGTGIAPEDRERIFEPFYTTKGVDQGTGLGLATVYGIVRAHHGYIHVGDGEGRGARFRIGFPTDEIWGPTCAESAGASARVVVAESDPAIRQLAVDVLRRAGHVVEVATSGQVAMQMLCEGEMRHDVAVLDVALPGIDGWSVLAHAHARRPELRFVLCGEREAGAVPPELARDLPGLGLLEKPYRPQDLLARLQDLLTSSGPAETAGS
jgi:signal transduction histidine kinase/CheY-like chemotaxis protein